MYHALRASKADTTLCILPTHPLLLFAAGSTWQMVQWPGPEPCQGNTWLYDCAQYMNLNAVANNLNGQATDQASAMAAVAAAKVAAEAQAAQEAQMAAMAAQQQQQQSSQTGASGAAAGPAPVGVPGMDPGVPGMSAGGSAGAGGQPAMDMQQSAMGAGSQAPVGMLGGQPAMGALGGQGSGMMGGQGSGMLGAGGPMMSAPNSAPGASLMGGSTLGHRHLLQLGAGAPLGMGGSAMGASTSGALPSTQLGAACQKAIQGVVTGAGTGVLVIPNFKGVAAMQTRGNDTMFIQMGGQGSQCVAGYKLMGGKIMDVGRTKEEVAQQQEATKKSGAAAAAAPGWALALLLACSVLLL